MRTKFVKELCSIAEQNENVYLITGDLGFGVLTPFIERFPTRFINAGIAEQNMTGVAAGLALGGNVVFTYSIGNFPTLRCLEQIRNDCLYNNLNVKIICVGSGFTYGSLGMSHHATEDIGILSSLPNISIFSPCDEFETKMCLKAMVEKQGTCYMRLGRGGTLSAHTKDISPDYCIGDPLLINPGEKVCIIFTGDIYSEVKEACEKFKDFNPAIYSLPVIKPLNSLKFKEVLSNFEHVITVEEHNVVNGIGSLIANIICDYNIKTKLHKIGIQDVFCSDVGDQKYLRARSNIDANSIISILDELK